MEKKIILVTEANERVASGHLFECTVCAEYMRSLGWQVELMVNDNMPAGFKQRISGEYLTYNGDLQVEIEAFVEKLKVVEPDIVIFNLREIHNEFLTYVKNQMPKTEMLCIDEFGNRRLDADVIINPMIDSAYWHYETDAELYCGEQYLILPLELQDYREQNTSVNEEIKTVTVSMGGVDAVDSTYRLIQWLPKADEAVQINIVLGGGYKNKEKIMRIAKENTRIQVYQNITWLPKLFSESDVVVCAGGNTLHELAVLGIPTIIMPGMPHEYRNGKAYEKKGFGICTDMASELSYESFEQVYLRLKKKELREQMAQKGKETADGNGYKRICEIVMQRIRRQNDNSSITSI